MIAHSVQKQLDKKWMIGVWCI